MNLDFEYYLINMEAKAKYNSLVSQSIGKVLIISKDNCDMCEQLKILFDTLNVMNSVTVWNYSIIEKDDEVDSYMFKNLLKEKTLGTQFPFCFIDGEYVGGYKQVHTQLITGKLIPILNALGIECDIDF
jgi:glutaredoxin